MNVTAPSNGETLVESDYGVEIEWNNVHNVRVTCLGRHLNRTSGLCGIFNRNPDDDFTTPNGTTVDDVLDFGNSWKVDPGCENAPNVSHPCDANPGIDPGNCSDLLGAPFKACASYVNATEEGYIEDCEYDVCACDEDPTVCLCQAIEAYVADCASEGVNITWKNDPRYQRCGKDD